MAENQDNATQQMASPKNEEGFVASNALLVSPDAEQTNEQSKKHDDNNSYNNCQQPQNNDNALHEIQQEPIPLKRNFSLVSVFKRYCNIWQLIGHASLILGIAFFSLWQILGKFALSVFHPVVFTFLRCSLTTVLLMPMMLLIDRHFTFHKDKIDPIFLQSKFPDWRDTILFAVCGFLLVIANNLGFAIGLYFTDPIIASIISQSATIFTTIIALILKVEKPGILKFTGIGLAVLGSIATILLNNWSAASGFSFSWIKLVGIGCFLLNNAAYALCIVLQKRIMSRGVPVITVTFWSFIFGTAMLAIVMPFFAYYSMDWTLITLEAWGATLYSGVFGGAIGFILINFGSKILGPTMMVVYSAVMPFTNSLLSYLILHTTVNYFIFIGAVIIISGVLLVSISKIKDWWIPDKYCCCCCPCCKKKEEPLVASSPAIVHEVELEEKK